MHDVEARVAFITKKRLWPLRLAPHWPVGEHWNGWWVALTGILQWGVLAVPSYLLFYLQDHVETPRWVEVGRELKWAVVPGKARPGCRMGFWSSCHRCFLVGQECGFCRSWASGTTHGALLPTRKAKFVMLK